jgi:hypothetical protein
MSKRLLQEIMNIDGVEGVFIASGRAKIIDKMGLKYGDDQLEEIALSFMRIAAGFHHHSQKINEIEFYWQNLFIVGKMANDFIIITACNNSKIIPLLRITLNVTTANLLEDRKFAKIIKGQVANKRFFLEKGEFTESEKKIISKLN